MQLVRKSCVVFLITALVLTGMQIPKGRQVSAAKKMKLEKKTLTLTVGKKKRLKVKNKKGTVKWKTSKKKVATVSGKGVVKAKKPGSATITAKVKYKKKITRLKCRVKVVKKKTPTKKPAPAKTPVRTHTKAPAKTPAKTPGRTPDANTDSDIKEAPFKISGTIYRKNSKPLANSDKVYLESEKKERYSIRTDSEGRYEVCVPEGGVYYYVCQGRDIDVIDVKNKDVSGKDVTVGLSGVSGTLTIKSGKAVKNADIFLYDGEGEYAGRVMTDAEGGYSLYAMPGTYSAEISSPELIVELKETIAVGNDDSVCHITAPYYDVCGTVYNNGNPWREKVVRLTGVDGSEAAFDTDAEGRFAVFLPADTYTANIGSGQKQRKTLEIAGDVSQDLEFSYCVIKGHIYRIQGAEFEDAMGDLTVSSPGGKEIYSTFFIPSEYEWYFEEDIETGTYTVTYNGLPVDTFTVSDRETVHDIVAGLYIIAGSVTGIEGSEGAALSFGREGFENKLSATCYHCEDGKMQYHIYLQKGTYTVYLNGKETGSMEVTGDNRTALLNGFNGAAGFRN